MKYDPGLLIFRINSDSIRYTTQNGGKSMSLNDKKPGKRPLYVYTLAAVVVILVLNMLVLPMIQGRSVEKTDYTTFLKNVDSGNVTKAEIQDSLSLIHI